MRSDKPKSHASSAAKNRFLLIAAAVLFSTGGAAIKACSLNGTQIASFRSGIASLALIALLPEARRRWNRHTILVGCAYAATLVTFVLANKSTTSANAIFLQATAPVYLLVLGPWLLHESIRRVDLLVISAVACGVVLMFSGRQEVMATAPDPVRGNLFGVASGVSWALTVAGLRWLEKRADTSGAAITTVAAGNVIACAACLPLALPVWRFSFADAATLLYLGVFQIGLAYFALTRSIRHVPALEAATLLMAEPALNPFWTWLVHGERPGALPLAGGCVVLTATMAGTWWNSRATSRQAGTSIPRQP